MLKVKVLGPGCYNCRVLEQRAREALELLAAEDENLEATIQKVTDFEDIRKYPIMFTPGLVINEQLVSAGRIPEVAEIREWLATAKQETRS